MNRERLQNLSLWLIVGLPVVSYPLGWLPGQWAQFRFIVALPIAAGALAAGLVVVAGFAWRGVVPAGPRRLVGPVFVLIVSWVFSTRFGQRPYFSLESLPGLFGNVALLLVASRFPIDNIRTLGRWWLLTAAVVALNGLVRLPFEPDFLSVLGNWNFLGAYLAVSLVIALGVGGCGAWLVGTVLVAGLYFCQSRGAWLALLGTGVIIWFISRIGRTSRKRLMISGAVVLACSLVAGSVMIARLRSRDVRPIIWQGTLRMIAARPLLGHGVGAFVTEYPQYRRPEYFSVPKAGNLTDHAHNELLEVTAEQGLLGLAATLWLWATALRYGFRKVRATGDDRRLWWGILGAFLVLLLHGMVDVNLRYAPNQQLLWILMGLLMSGECERPLELPLTTRPARVLLAGLCVLLAGWVVVAAVIDPVRASIWERRARLAEKRGDLVSAIAAADHSLRIEPLRLNTRYYLAGLYWKTQSADGLTRAIAECLKIKKLAPDYADITYNLGRLYLAADRPADALPYLERAVEINPYDTEKKEAVVLARLLLQKSPSPKPQ